MNKLDLYLDLYLVEEGLLAEDGAEEGCCVVVETRTHPHLPHHAVKLYLHNNPNITIKYTNPSNPPASKRADRKRTWNFNTRANGTPRKKSRYQGSKSTNTQSTKARSMKHQDSAFQSMTIHVLRPEVVCAEKLEYDEENKDKLKGNGEVAVVKKTKEDDEHTLLNSLEETKDEDNTDGEFIEIGTFPSETGRDEEEESAEHRFCETVLSLETEQDVDGKMELESNRGCSKPMERNVSIFENRTSSYQPMNSAGCLKRLDNPDNLIDFEETKPQLVTKITKGLLEEELSRAAQRRPHVDESSHVDGVRDGGKDTSADVKDVYVDGAQYATHPTVTCYGQTSSTYSRGVSQPDPIASRVRSPKRGSKSISHILEAPAETQPETHPSRFQYDSEQTGASSASSSPHHTAGRGNHVATMVETDVSSALNSLDMTRSETQEVRPQHSSEATDTSSVSSPHSTRPRDPVATLQEDPIEIEVEVPSNNLPRHSSPSSQHNASELWRLRTFVKFPRNAPVSTLVLAREGFECIGTGGTSGDDSVRCVYCGVTYSGWSVTDDVAAVHARLSPSCIFVDSRNNGSDPTRGPVAGPSVHEDTIVPHSTQVSQPSSIVPSNSQYLEDFQSLPRSGSAMNIPVVQSPLQTQSFAERMQTGAFERLPSHMDHTTMSRLPTSASPSQTPTLSSPARLPSAHRDNGGSSTSLSLEPTVAPVPTLSPGPSQTQRLSNNTSPAQAGDSSSSSMRSSRYQPYQRPDSHHQTPSSLTETILQEAASSQSLTAEVTESLSATIATQPPQEGLPQQRPTDSNLTNIGSTMTVPPATTEGQQSNNSSSTPSESSIRDPQTTEATAASSGQPRLTYEELGIITTRPKRPEFAPLASRLSTFDGWPEDHYLKVDDLANAGFYYAGYGDCVRCFYCGGGLRNWEHDDDMWVEHARWFTKCAFLAHAAGPAFVSTVTSLKEEDYEQITMAMVVERMRAQNQSLQIRTADHLTSGESQDVRDDPAVRALLSVGLDEAEILQAAHTLTATETSLSAENLLNAVHGRAEELDNCPEQERLKELRDGVQELRQTLLCKVCMDLPCNVIFLPCGHLVTCQRCSIALTNCPVCREDIRGRVHAHLA